VGSYTYSLKVQDSWRARNPQSIVSDFVRVLFLQLSTYGWNAGFVWTTLEGILFVGF
jgi:hypothetical protein